MSEHPYRCAGCGETRSIVEISLVPRVVGVAAEAPAPVVSDADRLDYGADESFYEAETVLGYGCTNVDCDYWHGHFGIARTGDGGYTVTPALPLSVVATLPGAMAA